MPRKENVDGSTPTTSNDSPFSAMVLPTTPGLAPNRRSQRPPVSTATRCDPHCSSCRTKPRPSAIGVPSASNKPLETNRVGQPLRVPAASQVERTREVGLDPIERAGALTIAIEIRRRRGGRPPAHAFHGLDRDQPVGMAVGQRPEQQRVHHAEHHAVGADPDAERGDHDRRKSGIAPHQAQREPDILEDGLDQRQRALIGVGLGGLGDPAERDQGLSRAPRPDSCRGAGCRRCAVAGGRPARPAARAPAAIETGRRSDAATGAASS